VEGRKHGKAKTYCFKYAKKSKFSGREKMHDMLLQIIIALETY
jgi:hypothetical protein